MNIFILFWLLLLIIISFLLYPKKTKTDIAFCKIYKKKGIVSLIVGMFFLVFSIISWHLFLGIGIAKIFVGDPYGGLLISGFGIISVIPFFIVFFISYIVRGIKFLFEFNKIKKLINQ